MHVTTARQETDTSVPLTSAMAFFQTFCRDFHNFLPWRSRTFAVAFSNSLIIHQAKTKKITTVKEVLIPRLKVAEHSFRTCFC